MRESGIANGLCLVNPMHITAAVYVNDDERGLIADFDDWLERSRRTSRLAVPAQQRRGQRRRAPEAAADGPPGRARITDGGLDLGPWEQVFYAEFDGRRRKRVLLKAIGE